jgi:hypothetical protein
VWIPFAQPEQRVPRRLFVSLAFLGATGFAFDDGSTHERPIPRRRRSSGVNTFDTHLDRGGDFHSATGNVGGSITRQFAAQLVAGVTLPHRY